MHSFISFPDDGSRFIYFLKSTNVELCPRKKQAECSCHTNLIPCTVIFKWYKCFKQPHTGIQ